MGTQQPAPCRRTRTTRTQHRSVNPTTVRRRQSHPARSTRPARATNTGRRRHPARKAIHHQRTRRHRHHDRTASQRLLGTRPRHPPQRQSDRSRLPRRWPHTFQQTRPAPTRRTRLLPHTRPPPDHHLLHRHTHRHRRPARSLAQRGHASIVHVTDHNAADRHNLLAGQRTNTGHQSFREIPSHTVIIRR